MIKEVNNFQKWFIAIRPFSFAASLVPVILGSVAAVKIADVKFNFLYFFLTVAAVIFLHSGANILSDINDFKSGVDKVVTPVSGALIRGYISVKEAKFAVKILLLAGIFLGLLLAYLCNYLIFFIGFAGLLTAVFYNYGNTLSLKYNALGDISVFISFSLLISTGSWLVQGAGFSFIPVLLSIPLGLLSVAIIHANNWRDTENDKQCGVKTLAGFLGNNRSYFYYLFLIFSPFLLIVMFVFFIYDFLGYQSLPLLMLLTLLSLPLAFNLKKEANKKYKGMKSKNFLCLDGNTARFNTIFGLLFILSILIN